MISPLAYVDPSAKIGSNVTVHPFAYIDKNVEIGDNNVIMPYALTAAKHLLAFGVCQELVGDETPASNQ
jgi:UDP-3-O-[3-hydroxymyristoyl] glucosamine N-acyltransferase